MTAEKLREAASGIRAEFAEANDWMTESERSFYLAVARWLERTAAETEAGLCICDADHFGLAVARAYLNEVTS